MKKFFLLNIFLFIMYTISGANLSIDEMQIISDINFDSYDNKLKNNTYFPKSSIEITNIKLNNYKVS
ncbi:MAG TPA: hypothetical protein DC057_10895, partial [Spirochaetia bacterium]|nr:hypothetical protein [Spirochaetia bacterium]